MVQLTLTEAAKQKLYPYAEKYPNRFFKLVYDTVGCGCVNDGVIYLALVDEVSDRDLKIESDTFQVYIEKRYEIYYEEELILDYKDHLQCFQLKSPNMIMNPRMSFKLIRDSPPVH